MKKEEIAIRITRGYAPDEKAEKRLLTAGVAARAIYRGWKGETPDKIRMRTGEYLGVVDGFRAFGEARTKVVKLVDKFHKQGATVIDAETKLCSRRDGARMLHELLSPPKPSAEYMRQLQEASVDTRVKGRMPKRDALVHWRNPKLSVKEAIALMKGWTPATAYNLLKKRDVPAGRRTKAKK